MAQYKYISYMSTTPTFITETLQLVTALNDCYREEMAYTALAYWASFHNAYIWRLTPRPLMIPTATVYAIIRAIELI